MQNIDLPKIITTDEENLDSEPIASKGPASLGCILDATDIIDTQTGFQSDPETQRTKQKSRSRFSAAFRRLSKSTRKKEHPVVKKDLKLPETTVPFKSTVEEKSQSTEAPSIEEKPPAKKKPSLSRRFLLGGLKRTKSSTKKNATDEDDNIILVSSSGTQTTNTLERRSTLPTQQHFSQDPTQSSANTSSLKESHTSIVSGGSLSGVGGSLQRLDRIRKVQITIRGKKIEHSQSEISVQTTGPRADSGGGGYSTVSNVEPTKEKDYLIPTEIEASPTNRTKQSILVKTTSSVRSRSPSPGSSPSKSGETADPKAKPKKKLKSKKSNSTTTKQIATTTTTTKTTKTTNNKKITQTTTAPTTLTQPNTTQSAEEKEKIIITSSTRDTPPRECAPAKPSRVVAVAGSDVAVSNVALATTSLSSTGTGAIRKQTTKAPATLISPRLTSTTAAKHTTTKSAVRQQEKLQQQKTVAAKSTIIEAELLKTQTDLMHNSQDGIERGHRFPRPSTPTTAVAAAIPTEPIETITIGNKTPLTTTAETPSIEITAPITTRTTHSAQHQRQIQFQWQSESEASKTLSLSSSPSQSLEQKISPTTDLQTTEQSSLQPPIYPPPPIPSGTSTPATRSPEHRSNSPLPSEQLYLATRFLPGTTRLVQSAHSSDQDEAAISSAESAQQQHSSYARNYGEISFDSNKSSESQSPISETSRKRIRYVAQPTLYDEDDIDDPPVQDEEPVSRPESRREALSYLYSAVSDYSLESEEGDQGDNQQMPAFGDLTMDQVEPPIMTSTAEKREHLYKILVIGELGTGKTSFIKRYVHQFFSQNYRATIGVDFALKVLHWDNNTIVRLQLWDIAGQERFGNMTRVYYKEAVGAFIVFDVTRSGTFDCVSKWKDDLDSKVQLPDGTPIPCILLANKCDQDKQGVVTTPEKMDEYVRDNGFAGWFETSAKENINIDEAARALVNKILLNDKLISAADIADSEKFNLNNSAEQNATETKSKCSC